MNENKKIKNVTLMTWQCEHVLHMNVTGFGDVALCSLL
jgi:hypothetical protein